MTVRVLIVAPSLPMVGGQSVQADMIYRRFSLEPDLRMSFQPINPQLPARLRWLQQIKYCRTFLTFPLYCIQLLFAIRRSDVVHVFAASYLSFVLAPTPAIHLAHWMRKRVILNYHSGHAEAHLQSWPSAIKTIRNTDCIAVPSPFLVRVFKKFGLSAVCVPNAVDLSAFRYRVRSTIRPVFLANRNLESIYGVGTVLKAFAVIQARVPTAMLTVAGDGPLKNELQQLARKLALRNVQFVGRVAPVDMPALYDQHDVWLNASNVDNMPLSILEAFASGTAIVSSNAGGIPDLVDNGRTGLLVECGDADALAREAIRVVTDQGLYAALAAAGHAECAKYTWDAVKGQWIDLYLNRTTPQALEQPCPDFAD